jgi:hypothetical protein
VTNNLQPYDQCARTAESPQDLRSWFAIEEGPSRFAIGSFDDEAAVKRIARGRVGRGRLP